MKGLTYLEIVFSIVLISIFTMPLALGLKVAVSRNTEEKEYIEKIIELENQMILLDNNLNFNYEPPENTSFVIKDIDNNIILEKNNLDGDIIIPQSNIKPIKEEKIIIAPEDLDGYYYFTDKIGENIFENRTGKDITIIATGNGRKHFKIRNYEDNTTSVTNLSQTAIVSYIPPMEDMYLLNITSYKDNGDSINSITNFTRQGEDKYE